MKPAIEAQGLGKKYRLGKIGSGTLRTDVQEAWIAWKAQILKGRMNPASRAAPNLLWAIRDVTFSIGKGESVGIIGQNGSGKSTLLKILSRITEPTEGHAVLRGRPAALLEVGTGFHPELSGRENIYLNAALLGLDRRTTRKRVDQIVEFAEVQRFLETPVKHYSSGMFVRLGFSVAAHLGAEILILDEILAVGDQEFRKKCLKRIHELSAEGCTVLIVSHDKEILSNFCPRSIALHGGKILFDGDTQTAVQRMEELSDRKAA